MAEIIDVVHPNKVTNYGIIQYDKGVLYFRPMNKKYGRMIVMEIEQELFTKIKLAPEHSCYSSLLNVPIAPQFLTNTFFHGEFLGWSACEEDPYARLTSECGDVIDANLKNYSSIILKQHRVFTDSFPENVIA